MRLAGVLQVCAQDLKLTLIERVKKYKLKIALVSLWNSVIKLI